MKFLRPAALLTALLLCILAPFTLTACTEEEISDALDLVIDVLEEDSTAPTEAPPADAPDPSSLTAKEDVAFYLWTYRELPDHFITKAEAGELGWEGGGLEEFAPGCCIGGDRFGNYEGLLPAGDYRECDIDTLGQDSRGAKRLVYTVDCSRIYYTDDHYESFTLLYGEE